MRTIVYIDGFNFFYGAIKGTRYKWLNLERFFCRLRQDDEIVDIKYFTALVSGSGKKRQLEYLRALATTDKVVVIKGKYQIKRKKCSNQRCSFQGDRHFNLPEEKQTDVNIAVQMVEDAFLDRCDHFVLVSGDSDLVPPAASIRKHFPQKKVTVYVPALDQTRGQATQLRAIATHNRTLPLDLLKHSQFPAELEDAAGTKISKPTGW